MRHKAVALARFDSFTKTALVLLEALSRCGFSAHLVTTEAQSANGSCAFKVSTWFRVSEQMAMRDVARRPEIMNADVLMLCLDGRETMDVLLAMQQENFSSSHLRPVLVSAYPGIILRDPVKGLMARAPADVLCLNSDENLAVYQHSVRALGGDASNGIVTGPPALWNIVQRPPVIDGAIVFFDQPNIPRSRNERAYVVDQLLGLAGRFPGTEIVVKPRIRPGARTFHDCPHPISTLLTERARGHLPVNLKIVYEPVQTLLQKTSVALTISSTAALEAMKSGVATRILVDLGLSEPLGTVFFAESGCLAQFRSIHPRLAPSVNDAWLRAACGPDHGGERFLTTVRQVLAQRESLAAWPFRPLFPFYGAQDWRHFADAHGRSAIRDRILGMLRFSKMFSGSAGRHTVDGGRLAWLHSPRNPRRSH